MVRNTVVRNLGKFSMNLWNRLPPNMVESRLFRTLGGLIHRSVCRCSVPRMGGGTYFLRNVPLLNAVAEQVQNMYRAETGAVRMCVIGCCTGAEVYSALCVLHSRFPQIPLSTIAMDISADSLARAEAGRYMPQGVELTPPLDADTLASLFDRDGDELVVKSALQQNIRWLVGDAVDPGLAGLAWPSGCGAGQQFLDSHERSGSRQLHVERRTSGSSRRVVCLPRRGPARTRKSGSAAWLQTARLLHRGNSQPPMKNLTPARIGRGAIGPWSQSINPEKIGPLATHPSFRRRWSRNPSCQFGHCHEGVFVISRAKSRDSERSEESLFAVRTWQRPFHSLIRTHYSPRTTYGRCRYPHSSTEMHSFTMRISLTAKSEKFIVLPD